MSDAATQSNDKRVALAELKTFLVCALLGPPFGGWAVLLFSALSPGGSFPTIFNFLAALAMIAPLSFLFGGVQGLISGIAMASYGAVWGRPPLWFALVVGLVLFFAMFMFQYSQDGSTAAILLVAHMVPAVLCWTMCRRFWPVAS